MIGGVDQHGDDLFTAWQVRSAEIVEALQGLDGERLRQQSALPDWDRLTIVCHLRYGAHALRRMTTDAVEGRPTAYYPRGREQQRASTLHPWPGESDQDVIADSDRARTGLIERWSSLEPSQWSAPVVEPLDNPDLGEVTLGVLVMAALTENECVRGLTDEVASTRLLAATDMTIGGIVKHLAWSEDSWLQGKLLGASLPEPWRSAPLESDPNRPFSSAGEDRLQDLIALYIDACDRSRFAAAQCSSLDQLSARPSNLGDGHVNLRWLLMHMLDETARHAGHIDLLLDEAGTEH